MERASQPLGYEFTDERGASASAAELDRRFTELELRGLRVYRIVWNGNFLVEATFSGNTPESRISDARALLGESGSPVHPDDLADYRQATESGSGVPGWIRRFFGEGR
jgi:pimeloyl-CoA synthetase